MKNARSTGEVSMNADNLVRSRTIGLVICLCLGFVALLASVSAEAQVLQVSYPFATDLADATGTYPDATLHGSTPPSPPSPGTPVCINGHNMTSNPPLGQDFRTPSITSMTVDDFQIDIEFSLTGLPSAHFPVIVAGLNQRWIGLHIDATGLVGVKYNNSYFTWSSTTVVPGTWYAAQIRYESSGGGIVQLYLDGGFIHDAVIGPLTPSTETDFTANDNAYGTALYGCIRNFAVSNDTTVPVELQSLSVE